MALSTKNVESVIAGLQITTMNQFKPFLLYIRPPHDILYSPLTTRKASYRGGMIYILSQGRRRQIMSGHGGSRNGGKA